MSHSQILFILQQIDSQLDQAHNRMVEINKILAFSPEVEQAQSNLSQAQQNLENKLHELEKAEQLVLEQSVKIGQTEAALYGGKIRIPKELQDLQNETISLKKYLLLLEDRQLECMEAVEAAQYHHNDAVASLDFAKASRTEQTAHLLNELSQIKTSIIRLENERLAALSPISSELLTMYENLRKSRNGVTVVKITGKSCSACGTTLTPAVLQSVQAAQMIIRCPSCSRILYYG